MTMIIIDISSLNNHGVDWF